jgi:hypothetical protein
VVANNAAVILTAAAAATKFDKTVKQQAVHPQVAHLLKQPLQEDGAAQGMPVVSCLLLLLLLLQRPAQGYLHRVRLGGQWRLPACP